MHRRSSTNAILEEYARVASDYDTRWSFYIEATVRETMRRLGVDSSTRLLDIGCGTGALLQAVCRCSPKARLTGIDPSWEMLRVARSKLDSRVELAQGWAESLPFRPRSFNVVVSCNSFHYWREPRHGLDEIARVLEDEGQLVVTDWCDDYFACRLRDLVLCILDPAHFSTYGRDECAGMLVSAGFRTFAVDRYKINWLWGLMTANAKKPS